MMHSDHFGPIAHPHRPRAVRRHAGCVLAASIVLATACGRTPAPPAPAVQDAAPSAPVAKPAPPPARTDLLAAFLRQRYGEQASLDGEWPGQWKDEGQAGMRAVTRRLCAEQPVVVGREWRQLLAVCGTLVNAGHPDPGTVDFFVLRERAGTFEAIAERQGDTFGSNGNPGDVSVLRLGRDLYGFRVEHGWYGQGFALVSQDLVVPGPQGLVPAGSLRSHIDNQGAIDCEGDETADCRTGLFDVDFDLRPDDTDRMAERWPLQVDEHGHACGEDVQERHRIAADPASGRYALPASLQREGCR